MRFGPHRTDRSNGQIEYESDDSLWSESEDDEPRAEEIPAEVTALDNDTIVVAVMDDTEKHEIQNRIEPIEEIEQFEDPVIWQSILHRRSVLEQYEDVIDYSKSRSPTAPNPRSPVTLYRNSRTSISQSPLHLDRMKSEIKEFDRDLDAWSTSQMQKTLTEIHSDSKMVEIQRRLTRGQELSGLDQLQRKVDEQRAKRRSMVQKLLDEEEAQQALKRELALRAERERIERLRRQQEELEREQLAKRKAEEERRLALQKAETERLEHERYNREQMEKQRLERLEQIRLQNEAENNAIVQKEKAEREKAEASKAEANRAEASKAAAQGKPLSSSSQFVDWKSVNEEYFKFKKVIEDIKTNIVASVNAQPELKKYCFQLKRKIKPKLGQLTDSMTQLMKILKELRDIFEEAKSFNNLAYLWALNFFSKAIVAQAETETTVSPHSALPLGVLSVQLMTSYEELKELLLARFVKKCPQVIAYTCPIDTEEGRLRMGWKRHGGKWEDEAQHSERIAGICSVWAVMTQTKFAESSNLVHPYPISNSWKFLARLLDKNTDQLTDAEFCAVAAWWDVAGDRFLLAYGKQATKMLNAVWNTWTTSAADKRFPAAARLRLLGEDWQNSGKIKGLAPMVR